MAGQPAPPIITEAFATNAPTCTQAAPVVGGKTSPFPVSSQISTLAGAASLNDGFVPLNMTDPTAGGVPPFGIDMNGILYLLSANLAALAAGQLPVYNATLATSMSGYALGALLAKVDGSGLWLNLVSGNATDPDTGGTGWVDWQPTGAAWMSATVPSGTTHDFDPPGFSASIGFLDLLPTTGAASIGSLPVGFNNQTVTVSNADGTNSQKLLALDGSATQPKFRAPADITLLPNQSITARYSTDLGLWLIVP